MTVEELDDDTNEDWVGRMTSWSLLKMMKKMLRKERMPEGASGKDDC
jgi:hypothetical protein